MSQNIPVRFVRADGETIQLPVTTVTLDVDRNFNATPLIFMGSDRMATDFNLSRAVILLEGVFTDDDLMSIGSATSSTAVIDFSRVEPVAGRGYYGEFNSMLGTVARFDHENMINDGFGTLTVGDIANLETPIKLKNTAGVEFDLYASKSELSHALDSGSSRYHFSIATTNGVQTTNTLVGGSGYSIANDVAVSGGAGTDCKVNITGVNSGAITSFEIAHPGKNFVVGNTLTIAGGSSGTFNVASVGTALTAEQMATNLVKLINDTGLTPPITGFSATRVTSPNSSEPNTAVKITQTVAGKDGNSGTPKLNNFKFGTYTPNFTTFKGGSDQGGIFHGMSAGDKVMSLYGTLNNSKNNKGLQKKDKFGDYIIGIQIPFNSSIKATGSNKYEPVNFFMPTGRFETLESKSVEDAVSASTKPDEPDSNNDRSFIKGGITKATFVQVGGEPVYSFNIQFIPASYII